FFQAEDGIRDFHVTGVQTCALPICPLVFPEGERTPDGTMRPFKPGIGLMAVRLQLEVVPVYLDGLFEVLSLHERWPKIHPVLVKDRKSVVEGKEGCMGGRRVREARK